MTFAHPLWFFVCLAVPVIILLAILGKRSFGQREGKLTAERLQGRLIRRASDVPRWVSLSLLLLGVLGLAVSLARPQGEGEVKEDVSEGRNVMLVLDLSRSMRVDDVKPDRLAQAKILIYELLEVLPDDRVGLVGFAGKPHLYAPLTIDHAAVRETVEQIDETWVTMGGSDLAAAVGLGTKLLKETGQKKNALVIMSDGEEHEGDLDLIVKEAERSGVTIFAVGLGTEDGGFVPHPDFPKGLVDRQGNRVLSRLQADVLRQLANETGGKYVIAGGSGNIPAMIRASISGMDTVETKGGETRVKHEFFQWLLLPSIVFLIGSIVAGTRWQGLAAKSAVCFFGFFMVDLARADGASAAKRAFEAERFEEAQKAYGELGDGTLNSEEALEFRLGEGLAAYEAEDFRAARAAFSKATLARDAEVAAGGHRGMGNTLFQLGWLGLSGERYGVEGKEYDMEVFDALVHEQLAELGAPGAPDEGESNGYVRLESIILNWSDAVRHFRSARERAGESEAATTNEKLTMRYLKRLQEILNKEEDEVKSQMPQPGEGSPQQGEGQQEQQQEGEGSGDEEGEDSQSEGGEEEAPDGSDGDSEPNEDEGESGEDKGEDPNETAEERAERLLSENQDLEKGSLRPGRREIRTPEKDW